MADHTCRECGEEMELRRAEKTNNLGVTKSMWLACPCGNLVDLWERTYPLR